MASYTIDEDFLKVCLRVDREEADLLIACLKAAGAYCDANQRQYELIDQMADALRQAVGVVDALPQPKPVVVEHDDGHHHPLTRQFDSLEEAARHIHSRDGAFGHTVDDVLQALHDEECYHGCDTWTIIKDH